MTEQAKCASHLSTQFVYRIICNCKLCSIHGKRLAIDRSSRQPIAVSKQVQTTHPIYNSIRDVRTQKEGQCYPILFIFPLVSLFES